MWFKGPFLCNCTDKDIFDTHFSNKLLPGEGVEADSGYAGRAQIFVPSVAKSRIERKQKSQVCGRHENTNRRLKIFEVMKQWDNRNVAKHGVMA